LVEKGLVSASAKPPFGPSPQRGRGRPARVFALTDRGAHAFDLAYDDLALSALRFLADSGSDQVAQFARQRSQAWAAHHLGAVTDDAHIEQRVDALVSVLNEEGYAATSVSGDGHAVQICQHHCPVAHVAEQFPQLCEAETQAFEKLLGTHVMRLATIAHGDGVCTTLVPLMSSNDARSRSAKAGGVAS
jgi:predicted ArsR family transcriptional regulator